MTRSALDTLDMMLALTSTRGTTASCVAFTYCVYVCACVRALGYFADVSLGPVALAYIWELVV